MLSCKKYTDIRWVTPIYRGPICGSDYLTRNLPNRVAASVNDTEYVASFTFEFATGLTAEWADGLQSGRLIFLHKVPLIESSVNPREELYPNNWSGIPSIGGSAASKVTT